MSSLSAISTAQLAFSQRSALRTIASPATGGVSVTRALPGGASPTSLVGGKLRLSTASAATAVRLALFSGNAIISTLQALRSIVKVSTHTSLVSDVAAITSHGTRLSRVNIEAEVSIAIAKIDSLVEESEFSYANLISSSAPLIDLQTTKYGGRVTVAPQPLDSAGLGIDQLDLRSDAGVRQALYKLTNALTTATSRVENLAAMQGALGSSDSFALGYGRITASARLPSGSLVNLLA